MRCRVGANKRVRMMRELLLVMMLMMLISWPVPAAAAGSRTLAQVSGVSRSSLIAWMDSHRFDSYYLTTPYIGGDWRSPRGDTSFNGSMGMNCTGFVWHALTKGGGQGIPGIIGWLDYIEYNDLEHYDFSSKAQMLSSGVLEKGDVIWIWASDKYDINPYHHIGLFWGANSSDDLFWHSSDSVGSNAITTIQGKAGVSSFTVVKTDNKGFIDVRKVSAKPQVTDGNSDFSLNNARFGIYTNSSASGTALGTITTNANGRATSGPLSPGTYYVKEITAPSGYELNPTVFRVVVVSGQTTRVNGSGGQVSDVPAKGTIALTKRSGWDEISSDNECYSLAGAVYSVYADAACTQLVTTMTTDQQGKATSVDLDAGSYFVRETTAAPGYALDEGRYEVVVHPKRTSLVNEIDGFVVDQPRHNPIDIALVKIDAETEGHNAQGSATLAGAQFELCYYPGYRPLDDYSWIATTAPKKTWILCTDEGGIARLSEAHLVSGDDLVYDDAGHATIGLGTITIREMKAPEGYLADTKTIHAQHITAHGEVPTVSTFCEPVIANQIKRGDIELVKVSEETYARMGAVPFRITSSTTGESHVILTDANGFASTASAFNPHSQNTNRGETADDGVWFGALDALDDQKGALPFDRYLIEELGCSANAGRPLIKPFSITITRDKHIVSLGTLQNKAPIVPTIGTSAIDGHSATKTVSADGEALIVDTVSFVDLAPSTDYVIHGVLMDKQSGQRLEIDGAPILSQCSFTSPAGIAPVAGSVELLFLFDAADLGGHEIVVFEYLYRGDELIATHEDIDDADQTVEVTPPQLHTRARDGKSGTNRLTHGGESVIIDTVSYTNLIVGKTYQIDGILMEKSTANPLIIGSREVTATHQFIASSSHGSVEVTFTVSWDATRDLDIVVFEYLSRDGRMLAAHADIDDESQTILVRTPEKAPRVPASEETSGTLPATGDLSACGHIPLLAAGVVIIASMAFLSDPHPGSRVERRRHRDRREG